MKRLLFLLAAVILAVGIFCTAWADPAGGTTEPEVHISNYYKYIILEDGTAEIVYFFEEVIDLIIPEELDGIKVTSIGRKAFEYHHFSTAVIPDTVTRIECRAFSGCTSMTSITIPDSVTSIGDSAFTFCDALTEITIPDSVSRIDGNPFSKMHAMKDIHVSPDHPYLEVVDGVLFSKPDRRLICYPWAFDEKSYVVPEGTQEIGEEAFYYCSLYYITIPDSVTAIGPVAFHGCQHLYATVGRNSFAEKYCQENGISYKTVP